MSCQRNNTSLFSFSLNTFITGCMWYVQLRLSPLILMIPDKCLLVEFLLLRRDSKMVLLSVCKQILMPETQAKLTTISRVFNMLNKVYFNYLEAEVQAMVSKNLLQIFVSFFFLYLYCAP